MFILHKNLTKWVAGCTKTFGEGVEGVAVREGSTDSGHSHWAGAKLRGGGTQTRPQLPLHALACILLACGQEKVPGARDTFLTLRSPKIAGEGSGEPPPQLAAEYCIQYT